MPVLLQTIIIIHKLPYQYYIAIQTHLDNLRTKLNVFSVRTNSFNIDTKKYFAEKMHLFLRLSFICTVGEAEDPVVDTELGWTVDTALLTELVLLALILAVGARIKLDRAVVAPVSGNKIRFIS